MYCCTLAKFWYPIETFAVPVTVLHFHSFCWGQFFRGNKKRCVFKGIFGPKLLIEQPKMPFWLFFFVQNLPTYAFSGLRCLASKDQLYFRKFLHRTKVERTYPPVPGMCRTLSFQTDTTHHEHKYSISLDKRWQLKLHAVFLISIGFFFKFYPNKDQSWPSLFDRWSDNIRERMDSTRRCIWHNFWRSLMYNYY